MPEENEKNKIQELERDLQSLKKELESVLKEGENWEIKRNQILTEVDRLKEKRKPLLKEEEEVEAKKEEIEKKEKIAPSEEKRNLERRRWKIEEKRHEIERAKWEIETEIRKLKEKITPINFEYQKIIKKEEELKKEIKIIETHQKRIKLKEKWQKAEEKITSQGKEIDKMRKNLKEVREDLDEILAKEKEIENLIKDIEKKERETVSSLQREKLEKERWKKERERKKTEKKKWQLREEKEKIETNLKTLRTDYQKLLEQQENLEKEIKETEAFLEEKEKVPEEKVPEEKEEVKEEMLEKKEKVPEIKKGKPKIEEREKPKEKEKPKMEERIRTMARDIARLREIKARKEKKEILEPEEVKKLPKIEKAPFKALIPKKKPGFQKILVRAIIVLLCFSIFGFLYWFFAVRKPPLPEQKIPSNQEIVEKPEIIIPPSLISVKETKTPEISEIGEIPGVFGRLMKEEFPQGSFIRVAIKNISENRLVSLEQFSQVFQIEPPKEIFQKLEKNFTLAIYSQKEGKRVALVTKIKEKKGWPELLKNWKEKISKQGLFFSGQKISTLSPYFKTSSHQEVDFNYLTIFRKDLGICYTWFDPYFIFTTSFESIKKIIEELKAEIEKRTGQLFLVGFEGKTITPELENFFKKYKPGGVLLLSKNIESKDQLKNLISGLQDLSLKETGLPLFVAVDQEGKPLSPIGFLKEKTSQSEIKNTEQAYQIGLKRGQELKKLGVNLNLAPVLDFCQEGDFIFNRCFQKAPQQIGQLAKAIISGQKQAGILTAIKHFPGYGKISFNPEKKLAVLEKIPEISQFKKAIEANPELIMISNVIYKEIEPNLPFSFSPKAIQFLKNNLGSNILIISDDLNQNYLLNKFSLKEIIKRPIEAGADILIFSGYKLSVERGLDEFFSLLKNKEISKERVDKAISQIINLKKKILK